MPVYRRRTHTITIVVVDVIEGGVIAIVAGTADYSGRIGVVVITIDIRADTVAVHIANAGAVVAENAGAVAIAVINIIDGRSCRRRRRRRAGVTSGSLSSQLHRHRRHRRRRRQYRCRRWGFRAVTVGVDPIIKRGIVSIVARHANVSRYIGAFKTKFRWHIRYKARRFYSPPRRSLLCAALRLRLGKATELLEVKPGRSTIS